MKKALMGADAKTSLSLVIIVIVCPHLVFYAPGAEFCFRGGNFFFDSSPDKNISGPLPPPKNEICLSVEIIRFQIN